jgi:peptidoglycan/LPS O-acetylase OafA/YrhL
MASSKRLYSLDVLRFFAVLLVLGRHTDGALEIPSLSPLLSKIVLEATRGWHQFGWIGVDLFFVLSGFLVSGLLFKEKLATGQIRFGRFFVRRGLKIYPSFYVLMVATILAAWLPLSSAPVLSELLFVQNYGPNIWPHTWSLAVEEHFYLLLALSFFLLGVGTHSRRYRSMPYWCAAILVFCLGARIFEAATMPYDFKKHLYATHLRLDSLAFGVLLSYFFHFHSKAAQAFVHRFRWAILAAAAVLVVSVARTDVATSVYTHTAGLSALYLGFGGVLALSLVWPPAISVSQSWLGRGLASIGARSYSVYLWHVPVRSWLIPPLKRVFAGVWSPAVDWTVYVVGAFVVGVAIANLIEFPVVRLRDRIFPATAPTGTAAIPIPEPRSASREVGGLQPAPETD